MPTVARARYAVVRTATGGGPLPRARLGRGTRGGPRTAMGRIAPETPFRPRREFTATTPDLRAIRVVGCYHVSPHNTYTGRLTTAMLDEVLQYGTRSGRRRLAAPPGHDSIRASADQVNNADGHSNGDRGCASRLGSTVPPTSCLMHCTRMGPLSGRSACFSVTDWMVTLPDLVILTFGFALG